MFKSMKRENPLDANDELLVMHNPLPICYCAKVNEREKRLNN